MTEPVARTWQRIVTLLQDLAPATARVIRPPSPGAEVQRARSVLPADLPHDLLGWWAATDGIDDERDYRAGAVIPGHFVPLAVQRVREEYLRQHDYPNDRCCTAEGEHNMAAGESVFPYCTALVPVCRAVDGGLLCVDTRPGRQYGCLMDWYASEGAYATEWCSVTHLLTDVADRLGTGVAAADDEGMLTWDSDLG